MADGAVPPGDELVPINQTKMKKTPLQVFSIVCFLNHHLTIVDRRG